MMKFFTFNLLSDPVLYMKNGLFMIFQNSCFLFTTLRINVKQ